MLARTGPTGARWATRFSLQANPPISDQSRDTDTNRHSAKSTLQRQLCSAVQFRDERILIRNEYTVWYSSLVFLRRSDLVVTHPFLEKRRNIHDEMPFLNQHFVPIPTYCVVCLSLFQLSTPQRPGVLVFLCVSSDVFCALLFALLDPALQVLTEQKGDKRKNQGSRQYPRGARNIACEPIFSGVDTRCNITRNICSPHFATRAQNCEQSGLWLTEFSLPHYDVKHDATVAMLNL